MTVATDIFKHNLKRLRIKSKLTQETLAEISGVSDREISKIERGLVCPNINIVQKLAGSFGLSASQILDVHLNTETFAYEPREILTRFSSELAYLTLSEQQYFLQIIIDYVRMKKKNSMAEPGKYTFVTIE